MCLEKEKKKKKLENVSILLGNFVIPGRKDFFVFVFLHWVTGLILFEKCTDAPETKQNKQTKTLLNSA